MDPGFAPDSPRTAPNDLASKPAGCRRASGWGGSVPARRTAQPQCRRRLAGTLAPPKAGSGLLAHCRATGDRATATARGSQRPSQQSF